MILDLPSSTPLQRYKILSNTITPRPIAWVSTIFESGLTNLAPFSFFSPISVNPPIFSLCIMQKSDGSQKDTYKNIITSRKATISLCDLAHAQALQDTSAELPYNVSEANEFDIEMCVLESGFPPVPKGIKAAFMCELYDVLEISEDKSVLLEAKAFYIDDDMYREDLNFLPSFIGRVGRYFKAQGSQIVLESKPKPTTKEQ